ncbi:MAG: Cof-type HAD-IIB family hydrolase [Streptococcaceae bacterium]|nr:Cof-type HAD-IIB family hydrolase [Streptococcaceae bacterium]
MKTLKERAKLIKIILFDIDDTLRVKNTTYMPDSVALLFEKLRSKGIYSGIATGRNFMGIIPEIKALKPDFFITANGAYVEDKNQNVIYDQHYEVDFVKDQIEWLKSVGSGYVFYGNHAVAISGWSDFAHDIFQDIYGNIPVNPDFYKDKSVYQLVTFSDHDDQLVLPEKFKDKIRMVRWHPFSSDLVPMVGSKAIGAEKVLDHLGLKAENLMNFGDELNDRELFDFAGLSVAMKISHPEILEKADYITDTVENDGIYKALLELGIIE